MIITKGTILYDNDNNKYEITDSLKPGGFGQVFMAERINDRNKFAIKTMLNAFPSSEEYLAFQNELETASKIVSDNVIKYIYFHDGTKYNELPPYIIMELANNGTLKDLIDSHKKNKQYFSTNELLNIFLQLSRGMSAINTHLIHRDIKPENILVCDDTFKITDFGLAKYADATTRQNITFKGYGTSPYCAPELWRGECNTTQMDIYSMGIVFYELATLDYPYLVTNNNYKDAHLYGSIKTMSNKDLPPFLVSLITKMLQKPCRKRFSSWDEIINILEKNIDCNSINNQMSLLVSSALSLQNAADTALLKKENELKLKEDMNMAHCKKIMSYFNEEILSQIYEFASQFNNQYPSGKIEIKSHFIPSNKNNRVTIKMPNTQTISISIKALFDEDFENVISYERYSNYQIVSGKRNLYPYCRKRKVLAWGCFEDNYCHGYNILLLDTPNEEYGDWFILYNKNSGLSRNHRTEPFAFSYVELPREITLIDATHIYSSILEPYNINRFNELIKYGHLNSKQI